MLSEPILPIELMGSRLRNVSYIGRHVSLQRYLDLDLINKLRHNYQTTYYIHLLLSVTGSWRKVETSDIIYKKRLRSLTRKRVDKVELGQISPAELDTTARRRVVISCGH